MIPGNNFFQCPIRKEKIFWEEKDVFNPSSCSERWKIFYALSRAG